MIPGLEDLAVGTRLVIRHRNEFSRGAVVTALDGAIVDVDTSTGGHMQFDINDYEVINQTPRAVHILKKPAE